MIRQFFIFILAAVLAYPASLLAQGAPQQQRVITSNSPIKTFTDIVELILGYVNLLIPLLFAVTFLMVGWGVVNAWIVNGGNSEKIEEGKMIALWGVIGLVVMVGVWALVAILRKSLFGV
jgi:hypothetical protein